MTFPAGRGPARLGAARPGRARCGSSGEARWVGASCDLTRHSEVWQARSGEVGPGESGPALARLGTAWRGGARCGRRGRVGTGLARPGVAWRGMAGVAGKPWRGALWLGRVSPALARRGVAGEVLAWSAAARQVLPGFGLARRAIAWQARRAPEWSGEARHVVACRGMAWQASRGLLRRGAASHGAAGSGMAWQVFGGWPAGPDVRAVGTHAATTPVADAPARAKQPRQP